ncbi:MAG: hypothetical protein WCO78_05520 [Candidatus Roizmanbacteria bacterium]
MQHELAPLGDPHLETTIAPSGAVMGEVYPNLPRVSDHERGLIRQSHNSVAEARDIRRQLDAGLPISRAGEYPYFQATSLLKEFAGNMGNSVTYLIKNDHLYAPGNSISTRASLDQFARSGNGGLRAEADAIGFAQIEQHLQTADGSHIVQISPPSVHVDGSIEKGFGPYGFLNIFSRNGDQVTARHIMYEENGTLTRSEEIRKALGQPNSRLSSAESHLVNPIPLKDGTFVDSLMETIGLSAEWSRFQTDQAFYESHIARDPYVGKWIGEYVALQTDSAQQKNDALLTYGAQRAEEKLILAYKRATSLFDSRQSLQDDRYNTKLIYTDTQAEQLSRQFLAMPMRMSAGSCPTDYLLQSTLSGKGFMNYAGLSEAVGAPISTTKEWKKMTNCVCCPGCKSVSNEKHPHLTNGKEWICGNPGCKDHKADVYNRVVGK